MKRILIFSCKQWQALVVMAPFWMSGTRRTQYLRSTSFSLSPTSSPTTSARTKPCMRRTETDGGRHFSSCNKCCGGVQGGHTKRGKWVQNNEQAHFYQMSGTTWYHNHNTRDRVYPVTLIDLQSQIKHISYIARRKLGTHSNNKVWSYCHSATTFPIKIDKNLLVIIWHFW